MLLKLDCAWSCDDHELLELLVELVDLAVGVLDAVGEAAQGELGGVGRFVETLAVRA